VKAAHLALLREKDNLLPDLRFFSKYDFNGLGSRLDGPEGSLASLSSGNYSNWTLGLRLDVTLGMRDANAQVRRASLLLAQRVEALKNVEEQAVFSLQQTYRQVVQTGEQMRIARARLSAAVTEMDGLTALFEEGAGDTGQALLGQRLYADALRDEQVIVTRYNIALADFERQKETLLAHDKVCIAEGDLPAFAQARASEHIRQRDRAIVLRERPAPPTFEPPPAPYGDEEMPLPRALRQAGPADLPEP
jgi:outer membrane protein TolC